MPPGCCGRPAADCSTPDSMCCSPIWDIPIRETDTGASDNPFPMGQLAYWRKSEDERWAFGLGVFAPAGFSSVYDLQGPAPFAGPRHYKSIGALARILPAAAYQVTDRLSIGATCGVAVSHVELEGPYFLQSAGPLRGRPPCSICSKAVRPSLVIRYAVSTDRHDADRFELSGRKSIPHGWQCSRRGFGIRRDVFRYPDGIGMAAHASASAPDTNSHRRAFSASI